MIVGSTTIRHDVRYTNNMMTQSMKRLIIIGSSGSGKTTLAKKLSARLGIHHTELDSIFHQKNWQQLGDDQFIARVSDITDKSSWILCGNYYSKIGPTIWPKADMIIWCDYSFATAYGRLLRRTLRNCLTRAELWNGNRESFYTNFFTKNSILVEMPKKREMQNHLYEQLYGHSQQLSEVKLVRLKHPRDERVLLRLLP